MLHAMRRRVVLSFWVGALIAGLAIAGITPPASASHDCAGIDPFAGDLGTQLSETYPEKRFTAEVSDTRTGCSFTFQPDVRISTASVIKVEIMAGILLRAQREGRALNAWEVSRVGPMIRESADPETSELWLSLGGAPGMESLDAEFGLIHTIHASPAWGATITSAHDQVMMVRQALVNADSPLDATSQAIAGSYMTSVVETQRWGVSAGVPEDWTIALKNGFFPLTGIGWRINSVGFVEDPSGGGYAVAVLTDGWATEVEGIAATELVAEVISGALAIEGLTLTFGGTFRDDDHSIYQADIEVIAAAGITLGCNPPDNDRFCPDQAVTRGEMAAFLRRFLTLPAPTTDPFEDDDASIFEQDIGALAQARISTGCNPPANTRFCPDFLITRGEMAAFLSRALELDASSIDRFVDAGGHLFHDEIEAVAQVGITTGCNPPANNEFCPDLIVTREQMAAFLARAMN